MRYIQDPKTLELVPASQYVPEAGTFHYVIPDIQPYLSTIDGKPIMSRSVHRTHLRQHGCVEVGTEWDNHLPATKEKPLPSAVPDLLRAWDQLRKY